MDELTGYRIVIRETLAPRWQLWFLGMTFSAGPEGTVLQGALDQAQLHGVLERIRDLNLTLLQLERLPISHRIEEDEGKEGSGW